MTAYGAILMDPPWLERGGGKIKRGADRHYPLMKTPEIRDTILECPLWRPATNSHLWMWVTNNKLPDGLWLMEELGYRYVTNIVWVKDRFGLGYYLRGMHELCLLGVRGRTGRATATVTTVIHAARREHSRKPDQIYDVVEAVSPGPYAEIFSRVTREGWDAWGKDAGLFDGDGDDRQRCLPLC